MYVLLYMYVYGVQLRKPTQKEVIEKPILQTLDEQNALVTASGESGDGVGKNPTNDANVNEFNCKQQQLLQKIHERKTKKKQLNEKKNKHVFKNDSVQSNATVDGRERNMLGTFLFTIENKIQRNKQNQRMHKNEN